MYISFLTLVLMGCKPNTESRALMRPTVYMMFAPDCPLCKNYTLDIKELQSDYHSQINFIAVIPGEHYSSFEVDSFFNYYNINIDIIYDPRMKLVEDFGASITPEVFFVDESNTVLYQGKFDDWLGELGRRRQQVTTYYLRDAIDAYLSNSEIKIKKTKAIGCFIE